MMRQIFLSWRSSRRRGDPFILGTTASAGMKFPAISPILGDRWLRAFALRRADRGGADRSEGQQLRRVGEGGFEALAVDRFGKDGDGPVLGGQIVVGHPTGNQKDAGGRMWRADNAD